MRFWESVPHFLRKGLSNITKKIIETTQFPYSKKTLRDIRMIILKVMTHHTFQSYVDTFRNINRKISQVYTRENDVLNDNYWDDWHKDLPAWRTQLEISNPKKSGISNITSRFFKEEHLKKLVGSAEWMTSQQVVLFYAIIYSYFTSQSERLWPIYMNMDLVFRNKMKGNLKDRVLFSALGGSGPFVLKVLQQVNVGNVADMVSSESSSLDFSAIAESVFSNVPSMSKEEVQFIMKQMKSSIDPAIFEKMRSKSLGSASIAEAHLSMSNYSDLTMGENIPILIKFLRPMYAFYFWCEIDFLLHDSWKAIRKYAVQQIDNQIKKGSLTPRERKARENILISQSRKLLMFFIQEFSYEFDYEREYFATVVGRQIYDRPHKGVRSVTAVAYQINPFPVLVLEAIQGAVPVDSLQKTSAHIGVVYERMTKLANMWYTNVLWGNGFFHADLHAGNILWKKDTQEIWVIDYGSFGIVQPLQQKQLITAIMLSIKADKKNYVRKFIEKILEICDAKRIGLDELTNRIFKEKVRSFSSMFLDIITYSLDIGKCSHNNILLFGRGSAYIGFNTRDVRKLCSEKDDCPVWLLDSVVRANLLSRPSQLVQLLLI